MSSKRRTETKRGNLTPIIVGSVVAIIIIFFIAVFALQPSAEKNFFGGEINVEGDSLPGLSLDFNRDCVLFENFNYCQQLEPAANFDAPIISGTDINGNQISTDSNDPRIILFLAHWCPHCQRELPQVQDIIDTIGVPEGIEIIAIATSIDRGRDNYPPQEWLFREGWSETQIYDTDRDIASAYGLTSFPYWVFLDKDLNVIARRAGNLPEGYIGPLLIELANQ